MATREQIIELRLQISDPFGVIRIYDVAMPDDLPSSPIPQTAYYVASTGLYMSCSKSSGAVPADYSPIDLNISDSSISTLIDTLGAGAKKRALMRIAGRLGSQLQIVKNQTGAESVEFTSLLAMYKYYKELVADADEEKAIDAGTNTGQYLRTRRPRIGGGNL